MTPEVMDQARELGIFGNRETLVRKMARHSAPFTHPDGNRRYEGFILRVEDGMVVNICKHETSHESHDEAPEIIVVTCPVCNDDGKYCEYCNGTGKVTDTLS